MITPKSDLSSATPKAIQVTKPPDSRGSDLSTSALSNDSSIFDNIAMSDASSIPSDTEDHEVDYKSAPPRISSKTYMQQTTETIKEDPEEDSENGGTTRPAARVADSSRPTRSPSVLLNAQIQEDEPIEMRLYRYEGNVAVTNGNIAAKKRGDAHSPVSPSVTPSTPLTSAKREKSFFHLPKLNKSKSQVALPVEKSQSFKDQIKNVFHGGNNSIANPRPLPGSQPISGTGTPHVDAKQVSPQRSPKISPVIQSSVPPTSPGPRRVASVGPNMMLAGRNPVGNSHHERTIGASPRAIEGRGSRSVSDPPAAQGIVRAKTLKECGITSRGKQAGKGATATVTRCSSNGKLVALKIFNKPDRTESDHDFKRRIDLEFEIAHSLHHPNIVETMELIWDEGKHNWAETMEWCGGGDLFSIIKLGHMTALERNCCFKQLVRGVAYMHSMGIAHRDIKPENLLLNEEGQLKITDFGVSNFVVQSGGEHKKCHGMCGSEPYMAPEVHSREGTLFTNSLLIAEYDGFPLDVWGCGIVYITLAFGGIMWHKAAKGDRGYDRFIASIRASEAKAAKKEAKLAAEAKDDINDVDEKASISDDAMSRVSSALSFKLVSPSESPPNGFVTLDSVPADEKSQNNTPQRNRSFRSPVGKPVGMVQSPLPISKAAGAVKSEVRATPHFPPFESFQPGQRRLVFRILDPNPETRITAGEIMKDPWFKEIQCCSFDPDELFRVQSGVFDASKPGGKKVVMPVKHKHPNHLINGKPKK